MTDIEQQTTYSIEEAAELTGRSAETIRRHCQAGKLKAAGGGKGSSWQISRVELADWWKRQGGGRLFERSTRSATYRHSIKDIIPAEGWHSVYEHSDGWLEIHPLICFALFEEADGHTYVDGISDDPSSSGSGESEVMNFICYLPPGAAVEEYAEQFRVNGKPESDT